MPAQIEDGVLADLPVRAALHKQLCYAALCDQLADASNSGSAMCSALSTRLFKKMDEVNRDGELLGARSMDKEKCLDYRLLQKLTPSFGDSTQLYGIHVPSMTDMYLPPINKITVYPQTRFITGDFKELVSVMAMTHGFFLDILTYADEELLGTITGPLCVPWRTFGGMGDLFKISPPPDNCTLTEKGKVLDGTKMSEMQVKELINKHHIANGLPEIDVNETRKNSWKDLKYFLKGVKELPPYFYKGDGQLNDDLIRDMFAVPDAMHALSGFLHALMKAIMARLEIEQRKRWMQWAKDNHLYHATGKMYCYSWIIYCMHSILPREKAKSIQGERPFDLQPDEVELILATIELRMWCYYEAFAIRNRKRIFSAHGALVHFLCAAKDFDKAECTNPRCKCNTASGCYPGKTKRTTLFSGKGGSSGGVYFHEIRGLVLLSRALAPVAGVCESDEGFFKYLIAMMACSSKQWTNMMHQVCLRIAGGTIERNTNMTADMIADKRLRDGIDLGRTMLNQPENEMFSWKSSRDNGQEIDYLFPRAMVRSTAYICTLLFHLADYIYFQKNQQNEINVSWSTCDGDGTVTWGGETSWEHGALLHDIRHVSLDQMYLLNQLFLTWVVEHAHENPLIGFGLTMVDATLLLNQVIVAGGADSTPTKEIMLKCGWIKKGEGSEELQLPDCSRVPLEARQQAADAVVRQEIREAVIAEAAGRGAFNLENEAIEILIEAEIAERNEDENNNENEEDLVVDDEAVASGNDWNVRDLLEDDKPFYIAFGDNVLQIKVISIDDRLTRPITIAWGVSPASKLPFSDQNGYKFGDFQHAARPEALVEHHHRLSLLKDYGTRQFKIFQTNKNDDGVDEENVHEGEYKARLITIDGEHEVTIQYAMDSSKERVGIQDFFERLRVPPAARATKTKKTKQVNEYKKTFTDNTSGDRHTKRQRRGKGGDGV